jgi:hypothetical protein
MGKWRAIGISILARMRVSGNGLAGGRWRLRVWSGPQGLEQFRKTCRPKARLHPTHSASFLRKAAEWMGHGGLQQIRKRSSRHFSHGSILWRTEERGRCGESFDGSKSPSPSGCRCRGRAYRRSKPDLAHSSARLLRDLCGKRLLGGGRELQQRSASKAFA